MLSNFPLASTESLFEKVMLQQPLSNTKRRFVVYLISIFALTSVEMCTMCGSETATDLSTHSENLYILGVNMALAQLWCDPKAHYELDHKARSELDCDWGFLERLERQFAKNVRAGGSVLGSSRFVRCLRANLVKEELALEENLRIGSHYEHDKEEAAGVSD